MGYVAAPLATTGTALTIHAARTDMPATVADRPLYKDGTCRTCLTGAQSARETPN
jgi:hypothetical protein